MTSNSSAGTQIGMVVFCAIITVLVLVTATFDKATVWMRKQTRGFRSWAALVMGFGIAALIVITLLSGLGVAAPPLAKVLAGATAMLVIGIAGTAWFSAKWFDGYRGVREKTETRLPPGSKDYMEENQKTAPPAAGHRPEAHVPGWLRSLQGRD